MIVEPMVTYLYSGGTYVKLASSLVYIYIIGLRSFFFLFFIFYFFIFIVHRFMLHYTFLFSFFLFLLKAIIFQILSKLFLFPC